MPAHEQPLHSSNVQTASGTHSWVDVVVVHLTGGKWAEAPAAVWSVFEDYLAD